MSCFVNDITTPHLDRDVRVISTGIRILGISIGQQQYVLESCLDIVNSGQSLCDEISSLNDPQSGMLLLCFCHMTRINTLLGQCILLS